MTLLLALAAVEVAAALLLVAYGARCRPGNWALVLAVAIVLGLCAGAMGARALEHDDPPPARIAPAVT